MKEKSLLLIFLSLLSLISFWIKPSFAQNPNAKTLLECYSLALKQSETVAISAELIKEAEGRFMQAFSGILPRAAYSYSREHQDGRSGSNFTLREVPESKFVFSQPLFTGFKEFATIAAGRYEKKQRAQELIRAKHLLFEDVMKSFYLVLGYQQDLEVLSSIHQVFIDRIEELKKREELGRSRPSEIASIEARLSRLEAEIELIQSQKDVAIQLLEFLTGQSISLIVDEEINKENINDLETNLSNIETRPDVKAAKEAWLKAKKEIRVAQAGYWPEVSIDGNYYTKRVGNSSGVDWDATLNVDVPLVQGGETTGLVKEARAKANEAKLKYQETQRLAEREIKNFYTQYQSSLRRFEALTKAVLASQKNYDLQVEDFRLNLVDNLDVLQALEELQDSKRDLISVQNAVKQFFWNLKVAIGEIPDDAI